MTTKQESIKNSEDESPSSDHEGGDNVSESMPPMSVGGASKVSKGSHRKVKKKQKNVVKSSTESVDVTENAENYSVNAPMESSNKGSSQKRENTRYIQY